MFVEHKEVGEVIEAPAKVLKLSGYIRIGARLRPQCRQGFFSKGGSCALGAAVEAKTGRASAEFPTDWPAFFGVPYSITDAIINMNDSQNLSRETIADWLEAQGY